MDSSKATLKSIIAKLLATTAITSLVSTRIYSYIPQNTTYPYIRVGIESEQDFSFNETDFTHKIRVQTFSQTNTPKEAMDTREAIFNALNRATLTLDSPFVSNGLQVSTLFNCFQEDDGKTWQSIIEFDMSVT